MSQYASLLAAQGSIAAALAFLPDNTNQPNIVQLRDRLCRAQGKPVSGQESSQSPYERQPLSKGRPGPAAGHSPMPRAQTQQYYPHVSDMVQVTWDRVCASVQMDGFNVLGKRCSKATWGRVGRSCTQWTCFSKSPLWCSAVVSVWFKLVLNLPSKTVSSVLVRPPCTCTSAL